MGENSRMGVIVAAPTAGAGGVVPGMLLALEEERHIDPEKTVRALVVAGGIGSIIALSANISGAAGGCQNEVGVASSMGAGAVAYVMGGSTRVVIQAAALALKNTLGLVCDPVGGLVEVPCVKRNALFAVHGLTAAQLALAGIDSVIPMDEVVEALVRIGRALPRGLKETAGQPAPCRTRRRARAPRAGAQGGNAAVSLWRVFFTVFTTVFVAEIGDKTQLATMLFAGEAKVSRWVIFAASASALTLAAALGVIVGAQLERFISPRTLKIVAGSGFVVIGIWTLVSR